MEVMGIDNSRTVSKFNHQKMRANKSNSNSQVEHLPQIVNSAADSERQFTSSIVSRTGHTVKAKKTLQSSKVSTAQPPKLFAHPWKSEGGIISTASRSPLQEKEAGTSPSKKTTLVPFHSLPRTCGTLENIDNEESGKENEEINLDQEENRDSFGESDIFTSTDGYQYDRNTPTFTIEHGDDTTMDF